MLQQKIRGILEVLSEFDKRKNDGLGLAAEYPRLKVLAESIHALVPDQIKNLSNEDAARGLGSAVEMAGKSVPKAVDLLAPGGVVKVVTEELAGKALEDVLGKKGKAAVDFLTNPAKAAYDATLSRVLTAVSVAATLGSLELMKRADDWDNKRMLDWHVRTGKPVLRGSGLHDYAGEDKRLALRDVDSPVPRPAAELPPPDPFESLMPVDPFTGLQQEDTSSLPRSTAPSASEQREAKRDGDLDPGHSPGL